MRPALEDRRNLRLPGIDLIGSKNIQSVRVRWTRQTHFMGCISTNVRVLWTH